MNPLLKSQLFQEVNERMAELLERAWPTAPGDFLCECGRRDCRCIVTMALAEYRALRELGGTVLAPEGDRFAHAALS
jgi:hypothetical protein